MKSLAKACGLHTAFNMQKSMSNGIAVLTMLFACLELLACLSHTQTFSQEAERLKHENEELRKLGEDAVLDQQLSKALQETDKLKLAADAYKKELLQQKVGELQAELAQTTKRLKVAEEEKSGIGKSLHMA